MHSELIAAIKYRLEHPNEIPGKSHFAVYRGDIETLLKIIEENENERRNQKRPKTRET